MDTTLGMPGPKVTRPGKRLPANNVAARTGPQTDRLSQQPSDPELAHNRPLQSNNSPMLILNQLLKYTPNISCSGLPSLTLPLIFHLSGLDAGLSIKGFDPDHHARI